METDKKHTITANGREFKAVVTNLPNQRIVTGYIPGTDFSTWGESVECVLERLRKAIEFKTYFQETVIRK